jgi:hypothetical protein
MHRDESLIFMGLIVNSDFCVLSESLKLKMGKTLILHVVYQKVKVTLKVKLSPCLTKHKVMKAYWGSGGIAPFFDLGTRWR